ncbi:MAG TPA: radical SAM protein, partial [bacterium]|nr:radical SAM protein [bacterium]
MVRDILDKALHGAELLPEEVGELMNISLSSPEAELIRHTAYLKSVSAGDETAEIFLRIELDASPCQINCRFCPFATEHHLVKKRAELSLKRAVAHATQGLAEGANALILVCTGAYPFAQFIEAATEIRDHIPRGAVLIAHMGDLSKKQAQDLRRAGFLGFYHAIRLREGRDTNISIDRRRATLRYAEDAGLLLGTGVEPVGGEHTNDELVDELVELLVDVLTPL